MQRAGVLTRGGACDLEFKFAVKKPGKYQYEVIAVCDAYMGLEQRWAVGVRSILQMVHVLGIVLRRNLFLFLEKIQFAIPDSHQEQI